MISIRCNMPFEWNVFFIYRPQWCWAWADGNGTAAPDTGDFLYEIEIVNENDDHVANITTSDDITTTSVLLWRSLLSTRLEMHCCKINPNHKQSALATMGATLLRHPSFERLHPSVRWLRLWRKWKHCEWKHSNVQFLRVHLQRNLT